MSIHPAKRNLPPITGYTDRKSAHPGGSIDFKISVNSGAVYQADLVRLISGDPNPEGTGIVVEELDADFAGQYQGRFQETKPGSYGEIQLPEHHTIQDVITIGATVWPTLLNDRAQVILSIAETLSGSSFDLLLNREGLMAKISSSNNSSTVVHLPVLLEKRAWYSIFASYDRSNHKLVLAFTKQAPRHGYDDQGHVILDIKMGDLVCFDKIRIGSHALITGNWFNGKIEAPYLTESEYQTSDTSWLGGHHSEMPYLALWDLSVGIETQSITDSGPKGWHGRLINCPTRAVKSSAWDATEQCWRHAPEHYAAIHFHEDDLYDAAWETDFTFNVPETLKSGVYAARIRTTVDKDLIPFFISPQIHRTTAPLALWMPTFTYEIYANFVREPASGPLLERIKDWGGCYPLVQPDMGFGLSCYNDHSDGSAVCFASARRPDLTFRPGYLSYFDERGSGMRHFPADLHLVSWLEHHRIDYDIITDHEIDEKGYERLAGYPVVMSGAHPEYHTDTTRQALIDYQKNGGRYIYTGGNGFYWRIARHSATDDLLELRRAPPGMRRNIPCYGEYYHASDGTVGGTWREIGKHPQEILGVGFSAQGVFYGQPYTRSKESYQPEYRWVFAGIDADVIGDHGFSGGGAAGFELDRASIEYGTPGNTVLLASSYGSAEHYVIPHEEYRGITATVAGIPRNEMLRSDMVFFETEKRGAVFSVGSITFCGSLPTNTFQNDISTILKNVVDRFLDPTAFS